MSASVRGPMRYTGPSHEGCCSSIIVRSARLYSSRRVFSCCSGWHAATMFNTSSLACAEGAVFLGTD
eukprot:569421-Amphidinium_carterae.1